jgi:hypothetical protein
VAIQILFILIKQRIDPAGNSKTLLLLPCHVHVVLVQQQFQARPWEQLQGVSTTWSPVRPFLPT